MAGGRFEGAVEKVRPGTYINFTGSNAGEVGNASRGTVLIPLFGHKYGAEKEFITLYNSAPDSAYSKLGYSVFDQDNDNMLLIREAFKRAKTVIVYNMKVGSKASFTDGSLTVTAKYGGSRGNDIKVSVIQTPDDGQFELRLFLGDVLIEEQLGVNSVSDFSASEWVDYSGNGALSAIAGSNLQGGTDVVAANTDIVTFLDDAESQSWNTLAFPVEGSNDAVLTKIKYLREDAGKYRKAVCANFDADYEGIINVTNGVILENGRIISPAQATAWVAGADAAASSVESLTYNKYLGAVGVNGIKDHAASVEAINNGEFFFSALDDGGIGVEYDINSLVSFDKPKDKTYRKNRVLRTYDSFAETIMLTFPPNKFDNNNEGWGIMESLGKVILKQYEDSGAITNVDYDNDFKVDRTASRGDSTYFNLGIQAVDSAEKLYFNIKTR